jgi:hypothetical protein
MDGAGRSHAHTGALRADGGIEPPDSGPAQARPRPTGSARSCRAMRRAAALGDDSAICAIFTLR